MAADLTKELAAELGRDDLTLDELVERAGELLAELVPEQTRYKVTPRPDARTVRYYVTRGLLPKPHGYDGGRARYGGRHLLRLLALKKMQAEHHTLRRISRALAGASDDELLAELVGPDHGVEAPDRDRDRPDTAADVKADAATDKTGERVELALAEGTVAVVAPALADPARRKRLAASLVTLARWLDPDRANQEGERP